MTDIKFLIGNCEEELKALGFLKDETEEEKWKKIRRKLKKKSK